MLSFALVYNYIDKESELLFFTFPGATHFIVRDNRDQRK